MPAHPPFPGTRLLPPTFRLLDVSDLPENPGDITRFGSTHVLSDPGDAVRPAWRLHGGSAASLQVVSTGLHLTSTATVAESQGAHIQLGVECDVIVEFLPLPTPTGPTSSFITGAYLRVGEDASGLVWRLDAEVTLDFAYPTIGPLSVAVPVIEAANFDFSGPGFSIDLQSVGADDVTNTHRGVHLFRLRRILGAGNTSLTFYVSHNNGWSWDQIHAETYIDDSTATQLGVFAYNSDTGGGCRVLGVKYLNPADEWRL